MKKKRFNYLKFLQENGYLPHHRFDRIYRLSRENPSWAIIGFEGISSDELKFVISKTRNKFNQLNEPTRLENVETKPFL